MAKVQDKSAVLCTVQGPMMIADLATRNDTNYSTRTIEMIEESPDFKEMVANGSFYIGLDHPEKATRTSICSIYKEVAGIVRVWDRNEKTGEVIVTVDIIDTPMGRIAATIAKYGSNLGISTRTLAATEGNNIVPGTVDFHGADFVTVPSVEKARLKLVTMESRGGIKLSGADISRTRAYLKDTKQYKLLESINKYLPEEVRMAKKKVWKLEGKSESGARLLDNKTVLRDSYGVDHSVVRTTRLENKLIITTNDGNIHEFGMKQVTLETKKSTGKKSEVLESKKKKVKKEGFDPMSMLPGSVMEDEEYVDAAPLAPVEEEEYIDPAYADDTVYDAEDEDDSYYGPYVDSSDYYMEGEGDDEDKDNPEEKTEEEDDESDDSEEKDEKTEGEEEGDETNPEDKEEKTECEDTEKKQEKKEGRNTRSRRRLEGISVGSDASKDVTSNSAINPVTGKPIKVGAETRVMPKVNKDRVGYKASGSTGNVGNIIVGADNSISLEGKGVRVVLEGTSLLVMKNKRILEEAKLDKGDNLLECMNTLLRDHTKSVKMEGLVAADVLKDASWATPDYVVTAQGWLDLVSGASQDSVDFVTWSIGRACQDPFTRENLQAYATEKDLSYNTVMIIGNEVL